MVFKKSDKAAQNQTKGRPKTQEQAGDAQATKKGKKLARKPIESFSVFIYRVLKQVHPETGISKRSMSIMNSFIYDIFEKIAAEAGKLVRYNKK